MTAIARVRRTQRQLQALAAGMSLLWAIAAMVVAYTLATLLNAVVAMPPGAAPLLPAIVILAALVVMSFVSWRNRFVHSTQRVALWLEERIPELRYLLVTAVDPFCSSWADRLPPSAVELCDPRPHVARAARRSLVPAIATLALATAAHVALPADWRARARFIISSPTTLLSPSSNRLEGLHVVITPPGYAVSTVKTLELTDPASIQSLTGSHVTIVGPGPVEGLNAAVGDSILVVATRGAGWTIGFSIPDSAQVLSLSDGLRRRLIVIDPLSDQSPGVRLLLPASDTTVRTASGKVGLRAELTDDYGLGNAWFEYIVTSGDDEGQYKFRQGVIAARDLKLEESGTLDATMDLDKFGLKPGEKLHVRAIAVDNNTLSGPDSGFSETRTIRFARAGEYDSLAVEGSAPPIDTTTTTLRILIQRAESLHAERGRLRRDTLVARANRLGVQVGRVGTAVALLQAELSVDGFEPNPLLRSAQESLDDARRSLYLIETAEAIRLMYSALDALKKFSAANKYYIRGKAPDILVDLNRSRMAGKDTGYATRRSPGAVTDTARKGWSRVLEEALLSHRNAPEHALELLAGIHVAAVRSHSSAAPAIGDLIGALRAGRVPVIEIARARNAIDGGAMVIDSLPSWIIRW